VQEKRVGGERENWQTRAVRGLLVYIVSQQGGVY